MTSEYELVSPGTGAIGVVQVRGDVLSVLRGLGVKSLEIGRVGVREVPGVDQGVIAVFDAGCAWIMPHGGRAVLTRLREALHRAGANETSSASARSLYPESGSEVEAEMLLALSRAASPLAVDLLLDQPRRFASGCAEMPAESAARLRRLIDPPLVVAWGRANIGKSSLVNALARRSVSLVAEGSGTTRDHVGVTLNLGGLVVRYADTPGISEPAGADRDEAEIQRASQGLARSVASRADLILLCADATGPWLPAPGAGQSTLRVGLRADLGPVPGETVPEISTCVRTGEGLEALVARIRERLVHPGDLASGHAWRFWDAAGRGGT